MFFRPCVCKLAYTQAAGFGIGHPQGCINSGATGESGIALDFHVENVENSLFVLFQTQPKTTPHF